MRYRYKYIFILVMGVLLYTGCSDNNPVEVPKTPLYVNFEGTVSKNIEYDDILNPESKIENAVIDLYRIGSDGVEEKVNKSSVTTDYNGKYIISGLKSGNSYYLISARDGSKVYKVLVIPASESELRVYVQPASIISTAQSEVYFNILKNKYEVSFYDVSLLVDPEISAMININPDLTDVITQNIALAVKMRSSAYLNKYFGGSETGLQKYVEIAADLSANFARDLHFAESVETINRILDYYYASSIDALLFSGIKENKLLKLQEIFYRSIINSYMQNEELRISLLKSSALKKASVMNQIVISDFQKVNGNKHVDDLKDASKELKSSLKGAEGYEKIKSSFNKYNKRVMMDLFKAVDINGNLKKNVDQKIMTHISILSSDLNSTNQPEEVNEAFIRYFAEASNEVSNLLKTVYDDESEILANLLVMLYLDS